MEATLPQQGKRGCHALSDLWGLRAGWDCANADVNERLAECLGPEGDAEACVLAFLTLSWVMAAGMP